MLLDARTCERWFLVVVAVALMSARPSNLLPDSLNLDDDPSDDGDGSFWSQRWYGGYVDDFLVKLRHAVVDDGLDPLEPPDEVQDIDELSYMFLGRILRVAPSGDIFGQQEELRMSIQRWLETSAPGRTATPHGSSTRGTDY